MKSKPETWFFHVKPLLTRGWGGRFWLTSDGCLSIFSDWGKYGYWWTSPGYDIREFLCRADADYILGKLCSGCPQLKDVVDEYETRRRIKRLIIRLRRELNLDSIEARQEWEHLERSSFDTDWACHDWYRETVISDASEMLVYESPPIAVAFMKCLWPAFVVELRRHIGTEMREKARAWYLGDCAKKQQPLPPMMLWTWPQVAGAKDAWWP